MTVLSGQRGNVEVKTPTIDNSFSSVLSIELPDGKIVTEFDISQIEKLSVQTVTKTTISGAQVLTVQVSNTHGDNDAWSATTITVTPSTTANVSAISAAAGAAINGKKARLVTAAAITSGTYKAYIKGI